MSWASFVKLSCSGYSLRSAGTCEQQGSCCEGEVHSALLAVLSQTYRGTPFLVKQQTTTCSHFISPVLAVPLGPLVKGRHPGTPWGMEASFPFKTFPIHFLMAATCSPTLKPHTPPNTTPQPQAHTHTAPSWRMGRLLDGMRVHCQCHGGQRRERGATLCCSMPLNFQMSLFLMT